MCINKYGEISLSFEKDKRKNGIDVGPPSFSSSLPPPPFLSLTRGYTRREKEKQIEKTRLWKGWQDQTRKIRQGSLGCFVVFNHSSLWLKVPHKSRIKLVLYIRRNEKMREPFVRPNREDQRRQIIIIIIIVIFRELGVTQFSFDITLKMILHSRY